MGNSIQPHIQRVTTHSQVDFIPEICYMLQNPYTKSIVYIDRRWHLTMFLIFSSSQVNDCVVVSPEREGAKQRGEGQSERSGWLSTILEWSKGWPIVNFHLIALLQCKGPLSPRSSVASMLTGLFMRVTCRFTCFCVCMSVFDEN